MTVKPAPFFGIIIFFRNYVDVVLFQVAGGGLGQGNAGESEGRLAGLSVSVHCVLFPGLPDKRRVYSPPGRKGSEPCKDSPVRAAVLEGLRPREMTPRTAGGRGPRAAGTVEVSVIFGVCPLAGWVHLFFVMYVKVPGGAFIRYRAARDPQPVVHVIVDDGWWECRTGRGNRVGVEGPPAQRSPEFRGTASIRGCVVGGG